MIAWWRVSKRSHSRYSFRSIVSGINGESVRLYQPRRCIDKQLNTGEGCCSENAPSAAAPTDVASSHQSASQSALAPPTQQPRSNAGTFSLAGGARTVMTHIRSAATLREPGAGESLQRRAVSSSARAQPVKPTVPPTPGSVLPYAHHVLLRIAPPASHAGQTGDTWWPPVLERHPAFLQAFRAVAEAKSRIDGVVKVTAFDSVTPSETSLKPDCVDMMIFPAGICLENLPISSIKEVVAHHVVDEFADSSGPQPLTLGPQVRQSQFDGIGIFVCTHGSRDARCGQIGGSVAVRLESLTRAVEHDTLRVFQVSHIGGHKYAGNVVVYGGISPCDGDWFGGVTADNSLFFLEALLQAEVGEDGGVENPALRKWWRGRMGLSQIEQSELFDCCGGIPAGEAETDSESDDSSSGTSNSSSSSSSSDGNSSTASGSKRK